MENPNQDPDVLVRVVEFAKGCRSPKFPRALQHGNLCAWSAWRGLSRYHDTKPTRRNLAICRKRWRANQKINAFVNTECRVVLIRDQDTLADGWRFESNDDVARKNV